MISRIRDVLEMIRFSHTVFALPFALLAAVMAWTVPTNDGQPIRFNVAHLCGILVCMVCARSAAMAFNRLADRHLDRTNPRTAGRHLPTGRLTVTSVMTFTLVTAVGFILGTLLFLPNYLPLVLSLPVLAFLFAYSFAKRFTALTHFWLGCALMLAPVSTWIALRGVVVMQHPLDLLPMIPLGLAVLAWVAGFDIIYACQDTRADMAAQLHSVPARLGVRRALQLAAACHAAMVLVLACLPFVEHLGGPPLDLGWIYGVGLAAVAILLLYEHSVVQPDDLTRVNTAFFSVNAAVSFGLFAVVSLDLLL